MNNVFEAIRNNRQYRKFEVDDLLFVEFKCLIEEMRFGMWSEVNYLVFVTNGKKMWRTYKDDYTVVAGDALLVKKGANIAHQYHSEDYCALMIFLPDYYIKNFMVRYSNLTSEKPTPTSNQESDGVVRIQVDAFLLAYMKSLESYFGMALRPQAEVIKLKFDELLLNFFTSPLHRKIASYFCALQSDQNTQLKMVMQENFPYNLGLEEYAALCHMSLSSFKRIFNEVFDTTPGKWLTEQRVQLAASYLKTTDKPVSQIATDCGYEDPSHFTRVFKKHKSMTPNDFRRGSS